MRVGERERRSHVAPLETARTPGSEAAADTRRERSRRGHEAAAQRAEQTVEAVKTARAEQAGVGRHLPCQTCGADTVEGHLFENPEGEAAARDASRLDPAS